MESDPLFFEYATLAPERLNAIVGDAATVGAAILPDHAVLFAKVAPSPASGPHEDSSAATVVPRSGRDVLGVVYRLKKRQLELLDLVMACNFGLRQRVVKDVVDARGKSLHVNTYVLRDSGPDVLCRPTDAFAGRHRTLVQHAYELYREV